MKPTANPQPYQIIFFGNTPFEFTEKPELMKEFGHPENELSLRGLPVVNNAYDFVFDTQEKKIVIDPQEILPGYERIILPVHYAQNPLELDGWKVNRCNESSQQTGGGYYLADEYMRGYLLGRPVEFDFYGTMFTLDVNEGLLRQNDRPDNVIRFDDLEDYHLHGYELSYNRYTKSLADPYDPREHVSIINLHQQIKIDPLGMAHKYQISVGRLPSHDAALKNEKVVQQCRQFNGTLADLPRPQKEPPKEAPKPQKKGRRL
jgi:hypothetical protein